MAEMSELDAERAAHARTQEWLDKFQGATAAAAIEVMQLRNAAKRLVDALPKCSHCSAPATRAYARGCDRYCDEHGGPVSARNGRDEVPEYPRAEPLRKLLELLAEAATKPEDPTSGK